MKTPKTPQSKPANGTFDDLIADAAELQAEWKKRPRGEFFSIAEKPASGTAKARHEWSVPTTKGVLTALFWERPREIPADERQRIRAATKRALVRWMERNAGVGKSKHGKATLDPLFALSLKHSRDLRRMEMRVLITWAMERNDFGFFVRLGRALEQKPKDLADILPSNTLEGFLLRNWFPKSPGETPPLACLSPAALAVVVNHFLPPGRKKTAASIEKTAVRLGLVRASVVFDCVEQGHKGGLVAR